MAERKIESLALRKARLRSESELLRHQLHRCSQELHQPVVAIETGVDFAIVTADLLEISGPWRRAKSGRKWLTLPRVFARFLRWQLAA